MSRRVFIAFLVFAVCVRMLHCLSGDALLCAQAAAMHSQQTMSDPDESDPNESCCLCRGAVFVAPCVMTDPRSDGHTLPTVTIEPAPAHLAVLLDFEPAVADLCWPPPRSAKLLCALIACWQI